MTRVKNFIKEVFRPFVKPFLHRIRLIVRQETERHQSQKTAPPPFVEYLDISDSLYSLLTDYITQCGWVKSVRTQSVVDNHGNNIPWCSYPFNKFIENRLSYDFDIFEFGCGSSTLYYASRVKTVTSVEHDRAWYDNMVELIKSKSITNVNLNCCELIDEVDKKYSNYAKYTKKSYDIIIVDGRDRNNCIINSIDCLKDAGVIILDNSERTKYGYGINHLLQNGFKALEFFGMSPLNPCESCTTIFYREENILKI